ncbi:hypothetical protein SH668x_002804 [Planctomicrobium sp. SH668]|uniref:hypothetical protein n=1 Tax=Planctomicrobium sp. SH668 TaxID=3448126 RepID=UPI003F5BE22D
MIDLKHIVNWHLVAGTGLILICVGCGEPVDHHTTKMLPAEGVTIKMTADGRVEISPASNPDAEAEAATEFESDE